MPNFDDFLYVLSLVRENVDVVKILIYFKENRYFQGFEGFENINKSKKNDEKAKPKSDRSLK